MLVNTTVFIMNKIRVDKIEALTLLPSFRSLGSCCKPFSLKCPVSPQTSPAPQHRSSVAAGTLCSPVPAATLTLPGVPAGSGSAEAPAGAHPWKPPAAGLGPGSLRDAELRICSAQELGQDKPTAQTPALGPRLGAFVPREVSRKLCVCRSPGVVAAAGALSLGLGGSSTSAEQGRA